MFERPSLQPDQQAEAWDAFVADYEAVFEPFTLDFANQAIRALDVVPGDRVLDVAAGPGSAALALARLGAKVTAIDASAGMVERTRQRAAGAGLELSAMVMDGSHLDLPDHAFDKALSVFGVILFPDAAKGLIEMARVVRPGGQIAVVTWTEPERYELMALIRQAIADAGGSLPAGPLPAQLRFVAPESFVAFLSSAGLTNVSVSRMTAVLSAPSVDWLLERLAFAPGMAAMLAGLGASVAGVHASLGRRLKSRFGDGPVNLSGVAALGLGNVRQP